MDNSKDNKMLKLLVFDSGPRVFAFNVLDLLAVTRFLEITPAPRSADFFEGMINLRGQLTPVINLSLLFRLPGKKPDNHTRLIAVKGESCNLCVVADRLRGFFQVDHWKLEDPPEIMFDQFVKSVYKEDDRLILVLNTRKLVNSREIECIIEKKVKFGNFPMKEESEGKDNNWRGLNA